MSLLRKQESRCLGPPKSPSSGLAFGQAGLSTARGEAGCFIRQKCYANWRGSYTQIVMLSLCKSIPVNRQRFFWLVIGNPT